MPYSITTKDGITIQNIPDDVAPDAESLKQRVAGIRAGLTPKAEPATTFQKVQASVPGRVLQGMRDPIDAAAQMLPRGLSALTSLGGTMPNAVSRFFDDEAKRVDDINVTNEKEYQAARVATTPRTLGSLITDAPPDPGFDAARMVGNVASPANLAVAARLPAATTTLGRVGVGVAGGAVGGALAPVDMSAPDADFASTKAAQVGLGATLGGVLTPLAGKVGDKVAKWWATRAATKAPVSLQEVERVARSIADEAGTPWENMAPQMQQEMKTQVTQAMAAKAGKDPAALARQSDFQAEGMKGTLGQITRDARQFAQERNLRQVPGTGDQLLQTFENQGKQLQSKITGLAAGAKNTYQAGTDFTGTLRKFDDELSGKVRTAYQAGRASAGKDAELPMQGLAQDVGKTLDDFEGSVPPALITRLKKYGIVPGQELSSQRRLFTVEEADDLLKLINKHVGNDKTVNTALGELRTAVKKAITEPGADDVFAPARKLAAERFTLHDAVPALKAAAEGSTAPDDFVNRFLINGKTDEVAGLAKILKQASPESYQQARAQIGAKLREAAFGQNTTGDKAFSPERYAKVLNDLGEDKLAAFFSKDEIARLQRLGRIGSYMNSFPNASPVQTSNNWGALMSLASRVPGVPAAVNVARAAKTAVSNSSAVSKAIEAEVPKKAPDIKPEDVRKLSQLLGLGAVAVGNATAEPLK